MSDLHTKALEQLGNIPAKYPISKIIEALAQARLVANPSLTDFLADAVTQDGGHHKQWYLEELATHFGIDLPDHEPGIAP